MWADRVANYVRDVAAPCGFARSWWEVRLRGTVPLGSAQTCWCKRGVSLVSGPQRVARYQSQTQSYLHFAPSTRTISAEGCPRPGQNAISPAFRALNTHDLRRWLRAPNPKRNLTCISRPRRARSPQRVAPDRAKTQSHLHFAPSTRTISQRVAFRGAPPPPRERKKRREVKM